jgi:hypothetical protein
MVSGGQSWGRMMDVLVSNKNFENDNIDVDLKE